MLRLGVGADALESKSFELQMGFGWFLGSRGFEAKGGVRTLQTLNPKPQTLNLKP